MEHYRDVATTLVARGYWTLPVNGKRPVDKGWTKLREDEGIVAKRAANGVGGMNTGIICGSGDEGGVTGIDIDVTDKQLSHAVYDSLVESFELLGELPLRIGRSPKCLVVLGCTDVFKKKKLEFTFDDTPHAIEILGSGQQFVSYGEHPDTGKPYVWIGRGIAEVDVSELAHVTEAMIDEWLVSVEEMLTNKGCEVKGRLVVKDERIADWLRTDAEVSIEGAGGDDTCYKIACQVKDEGLTREQCYRVMQQVWNPRCVPPWSDRELKTKVNSAYKYGTKEMGVNVPDFPELGEVVEGGGNPVSRYIFISSIEKYMHKDTRLVSTGNALNTVHGNDMAGRLFVSEYRQFAAKAIADRLGWFPQTKDVVSVDGVTYANTYRPPTLEPIEGDVSEWLALCYDIWSSECVEHCLDHMAYTVQFPDRKINWQILTEGAPRTGKSMVTKPLQVIFAGSHSVVQNDNIRSGWGDVWAAKKCIFAEEIYQPGDKKFFNSIKTKLANSELELLNIKTQGVMFQVNVYSIYMCTNHIDALHFSKDDDKLLVAHSPAQEEMLARGWTPDRYAHLGEGIVNGDMAQKVYHWLLNRDISDFKPGKLPVRTEAMKAMAIASRPDYQAALAEMLETHAFGDEAFLFSDVRDALKKAGYSKFGDRGVAEILSEHGYVKCMGKRKFAGKQKKYLFWSNSKAVLAMNQTEKYNFWNEYKISRYE